ncbi:hypothetical protein FB451DRAFT_1507594 [Mycena latifolia]|nr:hypothetical protein FB451DRAFT_1507594 [Mycena latifolia]
MFVPARFRTRDTPPPPPTSSSRTSIPPMPVHLPPPPSPSPPSPLTQRRRPKLLHRRVLRGRGVGLAVRTAAGARAGRRARRGVGTTRRTSRTGGTTPLRRSTCTACEHPHDLKRSHQLHDLQRPPVLDGPNMLAGLAPDGAPFACAPSRHGQSLHGGGDGEKRMQLVPPLAYQPYGSTPGTRELREFWKAYTHSPGPNRFPVSLLSTWSLDLEAFTTSEESHAVTPRVTVPIRKALPASFHPLPPFSPYLDSSHHHVSFLSSTRYGTDKVRPATHQISGEVDHGCGWRAGSALVTRHSPPAHAHAKGPLHAPTRRTARPDDMRSADTACRARRSAREYAGRCARAARGDCVCCPPQERRVDAGAHIGESTRPGLGGYALRAGAASSYLPNRRGVGAGSRRPRVEARAHSSCFRRRQVYRCAPSERGGARLENSRRGACAFIAPGLPCQRGRAAEVVSVRARDARVSLQCATDTAREAHRARRSPESAGYTTPRSPSATSRCPTSRSVSCPTPRAHAASPVPRSP